MALLREFKRKFYIFTKNKPTMNTSNYLKFFGIGAFALLLNTTVNAQNSAGKMDRQKAQPRVSQAEISAKDTKETKTTWIYSVIQIVSKDKRVEVMFEETKPQPKTRAEEFAYKMQIVNQDKLKKAANSFTSETDVLNYLAEQGYELVSVLPDGKEGASKMYYLRMKLPE